MSLKKTKTPIAISPKKPARSLPTVLVLPLVIFPLILVAAYTTFNLFSDLNDFTLSRRQTVAFLVATTLNEKLDRLTDVGLSISTRPAFQQLTEAEKWDEAIQFLEKVPHNLTYIDRISLLDPQGTLKASTPSSPVMLPVIGKDFSYRDYFQGASKNWKPYVGETIKPAIPLGYNLVPVAIPIKSESGKILGMLVLNIKLDTIATWGKNIDVGAGGFVYIVDQRGHLVAHPTLLPANDVVDFSSVQIVQKVLRGERGVEIHTNPIENEKQLSAYEPVPHYGWGAVATQPTHMAFVERDKAATRMAIIWVLVILAVGSFTYRLLSDRSRIKGQRDRESLLLESIGDGVIAIDRAFTIVLWNKMATALTGWKHDEAIGRPMREVVKFVRESDRKENIVFIEEAMLFGEQKNMENHTLLIRKDGTEILVGDSASPISDSFGKIIGAIIVFRDVSHEHEAQKIREQMVFRTVHDLRAPSTAIKYASEMYSDPKYLSKHPKAMKEGIELIKEANKRMLELINSLLDSARSQAGMVKNERVNLPMLIQGIVKEFSPTAAKKSVKIIVNSKRDLPEVLSHPERLKEIFSNLIDNAIKYNKEGGLLTIGHKIEGHSLKTTFSDSGVGIAANNIPKLFSPYFRANATEQIQGTGLGLFIVKKLVEEAQGTISVDSKIGKGTTFTVSLPIAEN